MICPQPKKWPAAELLRTAKPKSELALAAFHYQQAIEKYLKSILTNLRLEIPRTHDLSHLIQLCPQVLRGKLDACEAERLNPFAVAVRYPLDLELDTAEACAQANLVAEKLRSILLPYISSPDTKIKN